MLTNFYSLTKPGSPQNETTPGATAGDDRRTDVPMEGAEAAQTADIAAVAEGQGEALSKMPSVLHKLRTIFPTGSPTTMYYWTAI